MIEGMKWHRQRPITTVLFDLGGVLATDTMEGILFDTAHGLAPKGWRARRIWGGAAAVAWQYGALQVGADRAEFWDRYSRALGVEVTAEAAARAEAQTLRTDSHAGRLLARLAAAGIHVGLISDNTPFFYADQLVSLKLTQSIDPKLMFLSYHYGVTKSQGLYLRAAQMVDARHTLVVEDRLPLRRAARAAGFRVAAYHYGDPDALHRVLQGHNLLP
jgi:FMN phosphatase YigB (HAD superfamily)